MRVMITAIGTARSTPTTHIISPQMIMLMKISTGFTPSVLCIKTGMSTLFSNRWIKIAIPTTNIAAYTSTLINATRAAIVPPMIGPIYGINSVNPAMSASAHF